eukprot:GFUD01010153.1.p1 GENE.GFUD01010153.1~~GFUD01010153.1.p1  ORF type:complete len:502 (-),score=192.13 GFUD01010153.1:548-2053(-)
MDIKDDMEDGEISDISDGDEPLGHYTPLERPVTAKAVLPQITNDDYDDYDSDDAPALPCDSDSDSDSGGCRPKAKLARGGVWGRRDALVVEDGGGDTFKKMAQAFQEDRDTKGLNGKKKKNNVWGSLIQEESLNTEMSGALGVGRSLRDLDSDRGAETYDYTLIAKERREEEKRKRKGEKNKEVSSLDDEMDSYWSKKDDVADDIEDENSSKEEEMDVKDLKEEGDEEKRGVKRSVRERLGEKRVRMDRYKNEVLPPPGKPRQIPDIGEENLVEGTDEEFGQELAERLKEEKEDMIISLVKTVGRRSVWKFFKETQKIEASGGMVINNGARRRTAGGVMLHLLRKTEDQAIKENVKTFFNESQKIDNKRKIAVANKRKKKNFEKEMEDFLQARRELEEKHKDNAMDDGELKDDGEYDENLSEEETELAPLPNILSMIADSLGDKKPCNAVVKPTVTRVSSFKEPDAPPNSVEQAEAERALLDYDEDDFLTSTNETEDIELF